MKIKVSLFLLKLLIIAQYINLVGDLLPSYIQIIIFALWFISIIKEKNILKEGMKVSYISLIIFIIVLLRCIIAGRMDMDYFSPFQSAIARYQFFVYPFIFCYISTLDKKQKLSIFKTAIVSILITIIISLYYMIFVDPQAVRNTQGVFYIGVGDFQLMYAISILIGPILMVILEHRKISKTTIYLVATLAFMVVCILLCNLVTTWVIATISVFITLLFMSKNKYKYHFFAGFSFFIICMHRIFSNFLYKLAESNLFYWSTNHKIIAISNVLVGNFKDTDTLGVRATLISQSLTSFIKHPIFGINFKEHVMGNIGCHSQWFDDLARYGIVGNLVIWINYIKIAKYVIKHCPDDLTKKAILCACITTLILGFLNPCLSGTILLAIFVIIPTFDSIYEEVNFEDSSC